MFPLCVFLSLAASSAMAAPLPDLVATPARTGAKSPNDAAVVIGVEDYADVQDPPYAARDAEAFRSFLLYPRGVPMSRVQKLVSAQGNRQVARAATAW